MKLKYVACALVSLLLTACGPKVPRLGAQDFSGKTVHFNPTDEAPFKQFTFGDYTAEYFDITQGGDPIARARKTVDGELGEHIASYDPSPAILKTLKPHILHTFALKEVQKNADYEVTYAGTEWGMNPHPFIVTAYNIYYRPHISIVEAKPLPGAQPRMLHYWCSFKTDSKYAYDSIFKDKAAAVKEAMLEAEKECVEEFQKDMTASLARKS